jgi:ABC-2 type transport system permease protein
MPRTAVSVPRPVLAPRPPLPSPPAPGGAIPTYDSTRRPVPALEELLELWRYRDLVVQLVRRDVVARYKRSLLGVAWTMLNPVGTMVVLTVVFSRVFGTPPAYAVYLLSGLLAWNFFSQTTLSAMRQLVWGATLMHRIYVPRTIFAVTAVGTGLVNLALGVVPLFAVVLATGLRPRMSVLFLPVAMLLLTAFALGVGLLLSTLAAYFVDVAELTELALPVLLYLTPVIYPAEILPEPVRALVVRANPLHCLIELFRAPLYAGVWPDPAMVLLGVLWAGTALAAGWLVFTSRADEFPYRV